MPDIPDLTTTDLTLPSSLQATERGITAITLAEGGYSGLLVALWLDPEQAAQLAVDGGEAADQLHLTLAYCADMAETDDVTFARIIASLADVAALYSPLTGKVGGLGRFYAGESSDGMDVFYAAPDVPMLDYFREAVLRALGDVWVYCGGGDHGFVPHVTLAYIPAKAKTPTAPPAIDLTFSGITVVAGDRKVTIPFYSNEGTSYIGMFDNSYAYYAEKSALKPAKGKVRETWRFSSRVNLAEPAEWIQWLPAPGIYHHSIWGNLTFTPEKLERMVGNFRDGVYGQELPVDIDHELKLSGAVGYITDMRIGDVGAIEVKVDWNERGKTVLDEDRFKYVSADYFEEWQDPVTGVWIQDVPAGMAITTHPHFKTDVLRPLAASELASSPIAGAIRQEHNGMTEAEKHETPPAARQLSEAQYTELQARAAKADALEVSLTEASSQIKAYGERVDVLEDDARRKKYTDMALGRGDKGDGAPWPGGPEKHVDTLLVLAKQHGEESPAFTGYVEGIHAAAVAMHAAELMKPIGTNRGGDDVKTAITEIEQRAVALREADPKLTQAQAVAQAYEKAPKELKQAYRSERPTNRSDED